MSVSKSGSCLPMPPIGLGTFKIDQSEVSQTLGSAILDVGYRRLDCAPVYFNEASIGDVLQEEIFPVVPRSELYLVSKLASPFHTQVEAALRKTLSDLRTDYLDLFLIHWPVASKTVPISDGRGWENEDIDDSADGANIDTTVSIHDTWRSMEELVDKGLVREIGVSNFPAILLHELLSRARIPPAVNQCECHPYLQQRNLIEYCRSRGVQFQAYSPLGTVGYKESAEPVVLDDPILQQIAARHNVSTAQVALAWSLQRGNSVVVKSTKRERLEENLVAFKLKLSEEDMDAIASLTTNHRFFRPEEWWTRKPVAVFD